MAHVVGKIAADKAGEKSIKLLLVQHGAEQKVKQKGKRYAYRWWHDKSQVIVRIIVVHAMKNEMDTLPSFSLGHKMKYKAVQ